MATMIGLGEVLWDILPDGRELGGAPANFAFHAYQLGHEGIVVSRVGNDPLGREILGIISGHGLSTEFIQIDSDHPTSTVPVEVAADGTPTFTIIEDVAWDHLADEPSLHDLVGRADVVCFGTLAQRSPTSRRTIESVLDAFKGTLLFDINLRQHYWSPELVETGLRRCTIAKMNEDEWHRLGELSLVRRTPELVDWCRAAIEEFQIELVCVTRGERGCLLVSGQDWADHPGVPTAVADSVGSGDAFSASVAHGFLRGDPLDVLAELANRVGAHVASQPGGTPPLPDELRQL